MKKCILSSVLSLQKGFNKIGVPKKAMTLKEYYNNEIKSKMKVHN